MNKLVFLFAICVFSTLSTFGQVNQNKTYVNGYYKSNGTYVNGHYRTAPNKTINDNYSTYPNYNPYTGKQGRVQPTYTSPRYSSPTYSAPRYSTPSRNYYKSNW